MYLYNFEFFHRAIKGLRKTRYDAIHRYPKWKIKNDKRKNNRTSVWTTTNIFKENIYNDCKNASFISSIDIPTRKYHIFIYILDVIDSKRVVFQSLFPLFLRASSTLWHASRKISAFFSDGILSLLLSTDTYLYITDYRSCNI